MTTPTDKFKNLLALIGPALTIAITGGGMLVGFGQLIETQKAQGEKISLIDSRVERLYEFFVYPKVATK